MIVSKKYIASIIFFLLLYFSVFAQLDSVIIQCDKHLTGNYISDGQQYMSLLSGEQIAEFSVIFYGGNTYRVITCGGDENDIVFNIYDQHRNEIFKSSDHDNTSYWDFQFESTLECYVEAKLSKGNGNSGFVVLLIGLKK